MVRVCVFVEERLRKTGPTERNQTFVCAHMPLRVRPYAGVRVDVHVRACQTRIRGGNVRSDVAC